MTKYYIGICTSNLRAYTALTDTANYDTSATALFMCYQFSPLT
jgi:hypothetical protein